MKEAEILEWIRNEFSVINIATTDATLAQIFRNAIRYWNTNSAHKWTEMFDITGSRTQVSKRFNTVVRVYPAQITNSIFNQNPMWTLLGVTILDYVTSDLVLMSESFRNYQIYTGSNFQWHYEHNNDPVAGGYVYTRNFPSGTTQMCVVGTYRIFADDDIKSEYILDWILRYCKALTKMVEGNTLRKADIIGVKNDGQELINEGKEEKEKLETELSKNSRWVALIQRI